MMKKAVAVVIVQITMVLLAANLAAAAAQEVLEEGLDAAFLPLFEIVRPIFVKLSFVVGGLFGATLLLILARMYYDRKTVKLLKAIKYNSDQVNKHLGIKYFYESRGLYQQFIQYLEDRAHKKALKQLYHLRECKKSKHK